MVPRIGAMMTETEKSAIVEMLAPLLASDSIELVDVEAHGKTLRLLIHKRTFHGQNCHLQTVIKKWSFRS